MVTKTKVSELMDGELERRDSEACVVALAREGEGRDAWRTYHLIGDVLRATRPVSADFPARVAARIAEEPTVLAPVARPFAERVRWIALSAAASVAAIALVGWLALAPQDPLQTPLPLAQAPQTPRPALAEVVHVPPPAAAYDYLLAHQGYSPRVSLQGVAPYVRTVSGELAPRRQ